MSMSNAAAKAKSEVRYWENRVAKGKSLYRKYAADPKLVATLQASDRGGLALAKETLQKLQAEKCRRESVQAVKEMFHA